MFHEPVFFWYSHAVVKFGEMEKLKLDILERTFYMNRAPQLTPKTIILGISF